jgi:hypothetical protein
LGLGGAILWASIEFGFDSMFVRRGDHGGTETSRFDLDFWERNYEVFYGAYIHLTHVPLRLASYMVIGKQQLLLM